MPRSIASVLIRMMSVASLDMTPTRVPKAIVLPG